MFILLNGGYRTHHPRTFFNSAPGGRDHYLLLLVRTNTDFVVNDRHFIAQTGDVVLIPPYTSYQYKSTGAGYGDDWISFFCHSEAFMEMCTPIYGLPLTPDSTDMLSTYIRQLLLENAAPENPHRQENIDMLFSILLRHLVLAYTQKDSPQHRSPYYSRLQELRLSIQSEPYKTYTPLEMGQALGISASYFQHLYTQLFHIPFRSDLIAMRIGYAQELLASTDLSIDEIAEACGYTSKIHFYRQFRSITGTTPNAFRSRSLLRNPDAASPSAPTPAGI